MSFTKRKEPDNVLDSALKKCKRAFIITFLFAFAVNLLMLMVPLYSMQVLDKVISSASMETLLMLSLVMVGIYITLSILQVVRSFTLIRVGEWIDRKLGPVFFGNSVASAAVRTTVGGSQTLRDLGTVRNFLTSTGINTMFDAPWSIVYIIVLFIIHPAYGILAVVGGVSLLGFAIFNAYATEGALGQANEFSIKSMNQAEIAARNAESVEAMGMMAAVVSNWHKNNDKALELQSLASNRNGIISSISRFIRLLLQMLVTAVGAYFALHNEMTVGGMIAGSIIIGKALAPFESAIEVWKTITGSRKSYQRLKDSLIALPPRHGSMSLPKPEGHLSAENVYFLPPLPTAAKGQPQQTSAKYTLRGVSFNLEAGDVLAIIGPSAAGKSTLAKLIAGVWKTTSGVIRLDSADVYSWNRDDFGKHVGYLPQGVELFNGTVKENIARLQEDASPEDIVMAAKMAGVHDLILRLPDGYETDIGMAGSALSAGQRQRVGLARAFFGDPRLLILDEPNANLDEAGEMALVGALANAKARKITSIIISHRPAILSSVDKILVLQDGAVAAFGPRNEIMAKFAKPQPVITKPQVQGAPITGASDNNNTSQGRIA